MSPRREPFTAEPTTSPATPTAVRRVSGTQRLGLGDVPIDTSTLSAAAQVELAKASTPAAVHARTDTAYQAMVDVANGKNISWAQAGAIVSTGAYIAVAAATGSIAAASAAGGVTALAVVAVGVVVECFVWLSTQLGWNAGAGPGTCNHPNNTPGGSGWITYTDPTYGYPKWKPATSGKFEDWIRPAIIFNWETWTNLCSVQNGQILYTRDFFTGPSGAWDPKRMQALVDFWNQNHQGPSRTIDQYCAQHNCNTSNWNDPSLDFAVDPLQLYLRNLGMTSIQVNDGPVIPQPAASSTGTPGTTLSRKLAAGAVWGSVIALGGTAAYAVATKTSVTIVWQRFFNDIASYAKSPLRTLGKIKL